MYTFAGTGVRTLHAWVMDNEGYISRAATAQIVITPSDETAPVFPFAVDQGDQVRALVLASALRNRGTFRGVEGMYSGTNHDSDFAEPVTYPMDVWWVVCGFQGYGFAQASRVWSRAWARDFIDAWATGIGNDPANALAWPHAFGDTLDLFRSGGADVPNGDAGAWPAIWVDMLWRWGDGGAAFLAHHAAIAACLEAVPKDAGLVYSTAAPRMCDFAYHDGIHHTGHMSAGSAMNAWAYKLLADLAARYASDVEATYRARSDAYVTALDATLRVKTPGVKRGLYLLNDADAGAPTGIWASLIIAKEGLTLSEADRQETCDAIKAAYDAGALTGYGGMVVTHPTDEAIPASNASGLNVWSHYAVKWLAEALLAGGYTSTAQALIEEAATEVMRQGRANGTQIYAPFEARTAGGVTGQSYPNSCGFTALISDNTPAALAPVAVTAGVPVTVDLPNGHSITSVRVQTLTPQTGDVVVEANPYNAHPMVEMGQVLTTYGALITAALAAQTDVTTTPGGTFRGAYGATIRITAPFDCTVTLLQTKIEDVTVARPAAFAFDDFSDPNTLTEKYVEEVTPGVFSVSGGKLLASAPLGAFGASVLIRDGAVSDNQIVAVRVKPGAPADNTNAVGMLLRYLDPAQHNAYMAQPQTGPDQPQVYEIGNGVPYRATLLTAGLKIPAGVEEWIVFVAQGARVALYLRGQTIGDSTSWAAGGAGRGGVGLWFYGPGATAPTEFDDLFICALGTLPAVIPPGMVLSQAANPPRFPSGLPGTAGTHALGFSALASGYDADANDDLLPTMLAAQPFILARTDGSVVTRTDGPGYSVAVG